MENYTHNDELQHWGIKGQKWGQRRYQNKDGSLTPEGKKRYNQEVEKLKAEEAKIKAAEKVAATKKKTQAKLDKLDAKKAELEERKKKLKNGDVEDPDKKVETDAERKARALNSTDPKVVYANKDLLTYNELNERVNRIDLEARLSNKIPAEPKEPTIMDRVDRTKNAIDKATGLYKSVDGAVSAVANSYIGKSLAKNLGIELPKKESKPFDAKEFWENRNKKSDKEIQSFASRLQNEKKAKDLLFGTGDKKANGKDSKIDMDEVQNLVDEAVRNAMAERDDD